MLCMYSVLCMMRHTLRISDTHTMCVCWLLRFMCSQRAHAHIMKIYSDSIHSSVDRDGNRGEEPIVGRAGVYVHAAPYAFAS